MPYQKLALQFQIISAIRQFFGQQGFLDVLVPPAVSHPGMEPHIHPFKVVPANPASANATPSSHAPTWYLNTSPEFGMKYLLSLGFKKIFTITYSFRDEPTSPIHRPQFLMLEWYRPGSYEQIKTDTENLFNFVLNYLKQNDLPLNPSLQGLTKIQFTKKTVAQLFKEFLDLDILDYLGTLKLKAVIQERFPEVPLPTGDCPWEDYYFLLFLNKIEPRLAEIPFLLLDEFPAPLAALATVKEEDPRVCQRFEIYVGGIELANCFNELTDYQVQEQRWRKFRQEKLDLYHYDLPRPNILLDALKRGLPPSSGIALGVERFGQCLTGKANLFWP